MIGIPSALFYHLYGNLWESFFNELDIKYILSPDTNKEIIELGNKYAIDEMCLSLKIYIGHIAYLQDKCDYILVPRIDNYGINDQMCTNFIALYDIINNLFDKKIISYNIDYLHKKTEKKELVKLAKKLGKNKNKAKKSYITAYQISSHLFNINILNNKLKLKSPNKKILLISHPYNTYDNYIGKDIIKIIEENNTEVIDSNLFNKKEAAKLSNNYSNTLYWKYSRELIGSIDMCNIDGIIFLSSFPCGLDSLVNELVMRKISIPYLNIIVDDMSSLAGFETRIESFIDLINERSNHGSVSNDG